MGFSKRLKQKRIWNRIYRERLTEPLHLNIISFFVFLFGSFRQKVSYDLILRPHHAFGILKAADKAKELGLEAITILEFGVANGSGLINMIKIAKKVTKATGINIHIHGFDTGKGMPKPVDYRDHPEYYNTGDFPMNSALLEKHIDGKAQLHLGEITDTLKTFVTSLSKNAPIGFVSVDVDYYSSTKQVFELFKEDAAYFLPLTYVYFDDIVKDHHNIKCGELLAIKEFNDVEQYREISHHPFLENQRLFKNQIWLKQLYYLHVLDHEYRFNIERKEAQRVLDNPYLDV